MFGFESIIRRGSARSFGHCIASTCSLLVHYNVGNENDQIAKFRCSEWKRQRRDRRISKNPNQDERPLADRGIESPARR